MIVSFVFTRGRCFSVIYREISFFLNNLIIMKANLSEINNLLDALYLKLLELIEQQTACRINIERTTNAGQLLLAKTRYNQGSQTISVAQLPTENSDEFNALCQVNKISSEGISGSKRILQRHKVDKVEGYLEPLHWFTFLPSMSLRNASEQYKKSLDYIIESANIQTDILDTMQSIDQLKYLKESC